MKRLLLFMVIVLSSSSLLFSDIANKIWFSAVGNGINGNRINLLNSITDDIGIGQVGNATTSSRTVYIEQTDIVVGGTAGKFYFVNKNNNTSFHPIELNYVKTKYRAGYYTNTIYESPRGNKTSINNSITQGFSLDYERYGLYYYYDVADLYLSFTPPASLTDLEPGSYHCNLHIKVVQNNNQSIVNDYYVELQAEYLSSESSNTDITDYSFNITPDPVSYNFDIEAEEASGEYVKIADVNFFFSKMQESQTGNYSFTIAIGNDSSYSPVDSNTVFRFIKTDAKNQELTAYNSIEYAVKFTNKNTNRSILSTSGNALSFSATTESNGTKLGGGIFSGWANTSYLYLFSYSFSGEVAIKIEGDISNAIAGRYSTTLYYYVISNT